MRLWTPLLLLSLGVTTSVLVLRFPFSSYARSQIPAGCAAQSDSGDFDPTQTVAFWSNELVDPPSNLYASLSVTDQRVLGQSTQQKWIEIDLSEQKMTATERDSDFLES